MGTRLEKLRWEHKRLFRFVLIGSAAGGLIAYPLLIAAKLVWGLSEHNWWRIALAPLFSFGFFIAVLRFASWRDLRDARQLDDLDVIDR